MQTRWTVSVPAVKWRVFEQTTAEIREKFTDFPPEELQNIVDEACHAVRGEMRQELLKNGV